MSFLFFFLLSPYILAENEYIIEMRSFIKSSLSFSDDFCFHAKAYIATFASMDISPKNMFFVPFV